MSKEINILLRSGLTIAAKTWGNPENPPLIALHGWLDNANSFFPLAEYLQKHFYLVAVDLIGHGHSDHLPAVAMYYYIEWIEHVLNVADYLGFTEFSLLGHSMGAGIAPIVAACAAEKVTSLFLIEGIGPLCDPANAAVLRLKSHLKHVERGRKNKHYENIEDAIRTRMKNSAMTYHSAKLIVERGIVEKDNVYFWRHDPRLLYPSATRFTESQNDAFLNAIECPTTLIWAEKGYEFGSELIARRQQQIKHLSVHSIPGGHHAHMDHPQETAEIILHAVN